MKKRIIKIKDISQIDTSKVSVYDLNNRYLDPMGNLFGLKYNRIKRKIEIIKIERVHSSQTRQYRKKISQHRETETFSETDTPPETPYPDTGDDSDETEFFFEPDVFIEEVITNVEVHKERINGIIMNIEDSLIFPKENKMDSTEFEDIARNLDIEGILQLEKLDS